MCPEARIFILVLAGGLVGGRLVAAPSPPRSGSALTFVGKVVDEAGRPAGGATVYLKLWESPAVVHDLNAPPKLAQTTASADGAFRLTAPVRGDGWSAELGAAKEGHAPGGLYLGFPRETSGLVLALTPAGALAGRVVDRAGKPVSGAVLTVVWAMRADAQGAYLLPNEVRRPTTTDANGRFRLAPLPAGCQVVFTVQHPEYARWANIGQRIPVGSEDVTITLRPAAAIVGRVLSPDGQPVANVKVQGHSMLGGVPEAITDASGRFRLGNLVAENYSVSVALPQAFPDFVAEPQDVELQEGVEARCPDLRLARGGVVTGRATDENGQPIAGIGIGTEYEFQLPSMAHPHPAEGPRTLTDPDGMFRLRLPPRAWRLWLPFTPAGYTDPQWGRRPELLVAEDQTLRADLSLRRALLLRAKVVEASGRPAAGAKAQVRIERGEGVYASPQPTADAAGRLTIGLLLGTDVVQVTLFSRDGTEGAKVQTTPAAVRGEWVVRLRRLPALTGRVTDRKGAPIAGAEVRADRMMRENGGKMPERVTATATDARGRFSLPLPAGGEYWVRAHADGFDTIDEYPVSLDSRKPPAPLRFTLERTDGFIAGDVVGADGKPLAGVTVTAGRTGATNFLLVHETATTDAGGRFRIEKLPAGRVSLYASLPGRGNEAREQVPVGTANVRFVLQRAAPALVERPLPPSAAPAVGAQAPAIHVAQWVNGEGVSNWSDVRGKTVVLQFSAAFTGAARASNAVLKALHARLREAGRSDVVILAVYDASASAVEVAAYAREEGLPFPIGLVEPGRSLGLDSAAFRAYGVRRLPAVFVIDREGIVRAVDPTPGEVARLGN